jgi:hypothetical protein
VRIAVGNNYGNPWLVGTIASIFSVVEQVSKFVLERSQRLSGLIKGRPDQRGWSRALLYSPTLTGCAAYVAGVFIVVPVFLVIGWGRNEQIHQEDASNYEQCSDIGVDRWCIAAAAAIIASTSIPRRRR